MAGVAGSGSPHGWGVTTLYCWLLGPPDPDPWGRSKPVPMCPHGLMMQCREHLCTSMCHQLCSRTGSTVTSLSSVTSSCTDQRGAHCLLEKSHHFWENFSRLLHSIADSYTDAKCSWELWCTLKQVESIGSPDVHPLHLADWGPWGSDYEGWLWEDGCALLSQEEGLGG